VVVQLVLRVKDEFELEDTDLTKGEEFEVGLGDMFSNIEFSKPSKDDASFCSKSEIGPDDGMPFWSAFKRTCIGEVHISLGNMLQVVFVTGPLPMELLVNVGNKGDEDDNVP
jgi:hypothetical protein